MAAARDLAKNRTLVLKDVSASVLFVWVRAAHVRTMYWVRPEVVKEDVNVNAEGDQDQGRLQQARHNHRLRTSPARRGLGRSRTSARRRRRRGSGSGIWSKVRGPGT